MNETIGYIILGISVLSSLLPLLLGHNQFKTLLWMYILVGFCSDLLLILLKRVLHTDYQWLSHVYILIEFLLISFYYRKYIFNTTASFFTVLCAGLLFYTYTTFYGTPFSLYNVNGLGGAGLLLAFIAYSIAGFYKILKEQTITRLERSPFFWANTAFLLYSAGSIVVFICIDYLLIEDIELLYTLWLFKNILNIIKNIIFARVLTLKD